MKTAVRFALIFMLLFIGLAIGGKSDSTWVEKGTIQMDKLISLDSLWEKRDALVGKIVTLELGPSTSIYNGNSNNIKGTCYYHTGINIDTISENDWVNIIPYLKRSSIPFKDGDTLFLGLNGVNVVNRGNENETFPDWIQYNKPIATFNREYDIYPMAESSKKVITGFLIGYDLFFLKMNQVKTCKLFYMSRKFEIYPIGIKYISMKKNK